ncbi:hypothetical protein M9H77_34001 [Catharanthus roseus]|uniref:Uncharacterized protein n=1 Tax=Catharanthus roseus TaxID=4058 RepID=A0ACB9ZMD7_CATRO|nr:hypothetical protein M9H77_34001 [Catharanthus roseus]
MDAALMAQFQNCSLRGSKKLSNKVAKLDFKADMEEYNLCCVRGFTWGKTMNVKAYRPIMCQDCVHRLFFLDEDSRKDPRTRSIKVSPNTADRQKKTGQTHRSMPAQPKLPTSPYRHTSSTPREWVKKQQHGMKRKLNLNFLIQPASPKLQIAKVMKRHLRANDVSISYNSDDDLELCEPGAITYPSTIRYSSLGGIRKEFLILIGLGLRAASTDMPIYPRKDGCRSTGIN